MYGSLSRLRILRARRRGISDRVYEAEANTELGVTGDPYDSNFERGIGCGSSSS